MLRYFSLFSGIGGFELGIGDRAQCAGFSEIDRHALAVYRRHFPRHICYGDITAIESSSLPQFDLLVGGFPCQSFSIAGRRGGFADERGSLFFEIIRILEHARPHLLLLENVKGLLSHGGGATFACILIALDELGYDLQWQVLNSKNHGVPQNRERVFIVGHLRGTPRPEVFPLPQGDGETDDRPLCCGSTNNAGRGERSRVHHPGGIAAALTATDYKQPKQIMQLNKPRHSYKRVYGTSGIGPTLKAANVQPLIPLQSEELSSEGSQRAFAALTEKRTEDAKRIRRQTKDRDFSPRRGKYLERRTDDIGNCVTAGQSNEHLLTDDAHIRRLTPLECERLQGFPDGWTEGVSDSQRYKCLGNAVTVNVIDAIAARLLCKPA